MIDLRLVLGIIAVLCFLLAAFGLPSAYLGLQSLGLAFWALAWILPHRH